MNDREFLTTLKQKRQTLTEQLAALDLLLETCTPKPLFQSSTTAPEARSLESSKTSRKQNKESLTRWGSTAQYVSFIAKEISANGGHPLYLVTLAERYWKVFHADVHGCGRPVMKKFRAAFSNSVLRYCKTWNPNAGPHLSISHREGVRKTKVEFTNN